MNDNSCKFTYQPEILNSERYLLGPVIGKGTWGQVFKAKDCKLERIVAVKVWQPTEAAKCEMQLRNLTAEKMMKREAAVWTGCSHVVPRMFDEDACGRPFIIMPYYSRTLADIIDEQQTPRSYLDHGLSKELVYRILEHVSRGLAEIHEKYAVVHGDLKPANALVDEKQNILLSDFGNSHHEGFMASATPREDMGFRHTRAPECFSKRELKGNNPTFSSDVYGFGALTYRLLTGTYPFEHLPHQMSVADYFANTKPEEVETLLRRKIGNVPREFRPLLRKTLTYYSMNRLQNGKEIHRELEIMVDNLHVKKAIRRSLAKFALPLGIPAAAITLISYLAAFHEPQDVTMPQIRQQGPIYPNIGGGFGLGWLPSEQIVFNRETLPALPISEMRHSGIGNKSEIAKMATDNRIVAYLLRRYLEADQDLRKSAIPEITESQKEYWIAYTSADERSMLVRKTSHMPLAAIAKSIEIGLNKARTPEGHVDLEDALVISYIGESWLQRAQRKAESFEYSQYSKYILKEHDKFIRTWLGYVNSDPW